MSLLSRVLIYARGTPDEISAQQAACLEQLVNHEIVSLAFDGPDGASGWISANAMLADGEVDRIMLASRSVIPHVIDSVTQRLPSRRPRRLRPQLEA
jgi:hypothetical protein